MVAIPEKAHLKNSSLDEKKKLPENNDWQNSSISSKSSNSEHNDELNNPKAINNGNGNHTSSDIDDNCSNHFHILTEIETRKSIVSNYLDHPITNGKSNQPYLHTTTTRIDPVDAANFPTVAVATSANQEEFIEPTTTGYILTSDGVKLVTFKINDPGNPKDWSKTRKWYCTLVVATTCFCVALGSAIITGYLEGPMATFHVSMEVSILAVTLFVIGFGVGPMVFAPASELIGRQIVYLSTLLVALIFIIPCAHAPNIGTLLVCRFIDGTAFSAPMTLVGGTLADMWKAEERGVAMAFFSCAPFLGPVMGPLLGGFIGQSIGWRWIYWIYLMFAGACYIFMLTIPETYAPIILKRRAKKLRKETGDNSYKTEYELNPLSLNEMLKVSILRPFELLVRELIVFLMTIYMSVIYGLIYMFFFAFPVVFQEGKGFNPGQTGLTFLGVAVGVIISGFASPFINNHYNKMAKKYTDQGKFPPPELRLIPMMIVCWTIPIGLFIFAWTSYPRLIWVGPVLAGLPCGFGFCALYNCANNYLVDSYQHFAASALAAKTFLRSMWGAAVTLFTIQMYHKMGDEWASSFLAFISLACCVIPYLFYFYGARIRAKSHYAYSPEDEAIEEKAHPTVSNV